MSDQDDLIGDMIAEIARTHGVAISRDDPIVAVVLLNQVVLRRYLEDTVVPAVDAIRTATRDAIDQVEKIAEAQAYWLDQVSLKDRASFLEDQKALHDAWKSDMQALIEGQNSALQQVVMQTVSLLRDQSPSANHSPSAVPMTHKNLKHPQQPRRWPWVISGMLLGTGTTVVLAAVVWTSFVGQ